MLMISVPDCHPFLSCHPSQVQGHHLDSLRRKEPGEVKQNQWWAPPASAQPGTAATELQELPHPTDLLSMGCIAPSLRSSPISVLHNCRSYKNIRCFPKEPGRSREEKEVQTSQPRYPDWGWADIKLHQTAAVQKALTWTLMFAHRNK